MGKNIYDGRTFRWLFGTNLSTLSVIDTESRPDVSQGFMHSKFYLLIHNIGSSHEGIYQCQPTSSPPMFSNHWPTHILIVEGMDYCILLNTEKSVFNIYHITNVQLFLFRSCILQIMS